MKAPFVIYAELECLLEKMSTCHNNPEVFCIKNFCLDLKERATKIINNQKNEMIPLTNEE